MLNTITNFVIMIINCLIAYWVLKDRKKIEHLEKRIDQLEMEHKHTRDRITEFIHFVKNRIRQEK